ncbi:MarR family winged helix-turn-helix transcriptional regulator [Pseudooceanicola sp. CBS1P-1]|uniref:MarR family transcriptional regulator n=1 Tax=Pseudooceanicola albus TaxID=2692189 RepID=A0A6L7G0L5_9RHOB|nr:MULTISPECIES: MarR family winged helix-turn-helix transcriptional regulator [Pseudooceanicola]MBT9382694.1 MarR family winged helix-turn-helix transcriptional regulator [Pseudooceanicola endophyticus]MXN17232.1 MarR family transcriptional regulator [Pseudooceanicola albus]
MAKKDEQMTAFLSEAGIPDQVTRQALAVDAVLQGWRRRFSKRELGRMALQELGLDLDLPKLDVLIAAWAPANEFGDPQEETMVSTIAARLNIDPSRASRLVSELITQGLVQRGVSQQDARRTIVEVTPQGAAVVEAVRTIKFLILGDFLKGWPAEEVETFLPLLERFSTWSEEAYDKGTTSYAPTIKALREKLDVPAQ